MIDFTIKPEARKRETPRNIVGTTYEPLSDLPTFTDSNSFFFSNEGNDTTGDGTQANPYKTPKKAIESCSAILIYAVCLDSFIYDITEPITNTFCQCLYSAIGESCTLQSRDSQIPDGFIEALSDIDRSLYCEYSGKLYAVVDSENIYSFDGTDWTNEHTISGETITVLKSTSKGLYAGTDSGKIARIYGTASNVFTHGDYEIKDFAEYNNYIFAVAYDTVLEKNIVLRSANGADFTAQDTNIDDESFENEIVQSLTIWDNTLILTTNNNLCTSTDGLNYTVIRAFTYNSTLFKSIVFKDSLYLLFEGFGIFKSTSIDNFTATKISDISPSQAGINTHLYISDTSGNLYRTIDGDNFVKVKDSIGQGIGTFQGLLYIDDNRINSYMILSALNFAIVNVHLSTDILDYAVYNPENNQSVQNIKSTGFIIAFNYGYLVELKNSIIQNQHTGIQILSGTATIADSVFANLTGTAIKSGNMTALNIDHITIYNVETGIYIDSVSSFECLNSIIYFCQTYGIYSVTQTVYVENCIIARCIFYQAASISGLNVNPLFVSETDLHIRTKESGYQLESPAKEAGNDNRDIGAFDVERTTISQPLPVVIRPISQPSKIEQDSYRPYFQNALSISGGKLTAGLPERKRISLEWDSSRYTPDIDRLAMLLKNKVFYFSNDDTTYTGTGIVTTEIITDEMALFALSDIGDTFKVYRDEKAGLTYNELTGFQFQSGEYSARILYNTETEIYFSTDSDIPDGVVNGEVKYIKVVCTNENLKATRITQKTKLRSGFTLTLEEAD